MLRLTAKSTQFGRKTFTSWLIESAGTVPIKRRNDYAGQEVDNSEVMETLVEVETTFLVPRVWSNLFKPCRHLRLVMLCVCFRRV